MINNIGDTNSGVVVWQEKESERELGDREQERERERESDAVLISRKK